MKTLPFFCAMTLLGGCAPTMLGGCALTSKAEMVDVRYFAPDSAASSARGSPSHPDGQPTELRMGRIRSAAYLKNEIVYRESAVKFGTYDDERWTERPEDYLRRSLAQALFDERGVTQALSGAGPTLDVELLAFEEVRNGSERKARVSFTYALHDDRVVIESETVTVEMPTAHGSKRIDDVVSALGLALHGASEQLAEKVSARLREHAAGKTAVNAPR